MALNTCIILSVLILKVTFILTRCNYFWYNGYYFIANVLWNCWLNTILHKHYFGVFWSSKTINGSEWRGRKWLKKQIEKLRTTNTQKEATPALVVTTSAIQKPKDRSKWKQVIKVLIKLLCVNYEWTQMILVFTQNCGCAKFHGYLSDVSDASNNNGLISEDLLVTWQN